MNTIEEALGIDYSDPSQTLARDIVQDWTDALYALRSHRQDAGISMERVAESIGTTTGMISAFELGAWDAPQSFVRRYLHAIKARAPHTIIVQVAPDAS